MALPQVSINYLAVLVSAVASMIIGGLWYSPLLFGKLWIKLSNVTPKQIEEAKKKGMTKAYILMFISSLVMAYIIAHFVDYVQAVDMITALQLTFWIWLGFIVTVLLSSVLWEGKPVKLFLINISHYLVSIGVMSIILSLWV